MMHNIKNKTIIWKFVESLEPARLVHARVTSVITKGNEFAQVTIRFHTQQVYILYRVFFLYTIYLKYLNNYMNISFLRFYAFMIDSDEFY